MENTPHRTSWNQFVEQSNARIDAAKAVVKQASAPTATDPTDKGEVATPSFGATENKSLLQLPTNSENKVGGNPDAKVMNVTKPNPTGQGEYVTPVNGTAKNEAVNSFTTPLSKLAQTIQQMAQPAQPEEKKEAEKQATHDVQMQGNTLTEPELLQKLASIGYIMMGTEEGQRAMTAVINKEAGAREAQNIIAGTAELMKQANAYTQDAMEKSAAAEKEYMEKVATATQTHQYLLSQCADELEKAAYMQGAADGAAATEGVDPGMVADEAPVTDEEIMNRLAELVEAGVIQPEQAEQLLQAAQAPAADGDLSDEDVATILQQLVAEGSLTPEQAQQVAATWVEQTGGDDAAAPTAPEGAEAPVDDTTKEAAANILKAANAVGSLIA